MVSGRLLVVCKQDQSLEVLDLEAATTVERIRASGFTPHEVIATPDGSRAYLPIYSDAFVGAPGTDGRAIDIVDLVGLRVADTIPLDFASRPHLPVLGSDGRLFVGTELDESISIIDPVTGTRTGRLPTGRPQSHMFVLSPDGSRAYSANVNTGSVSVMDVATETLLEVVELTGKVNRISIAPDGSTVFCADQESARIAAIDTATHSARWIDLRSIAFGTAVTADGRSLVLALRDASQIGVLDLGAERLHTVIDVPAHPQVILLHPDGIHAYSACDEAGEVVEVDLHSGTVTRTFPTGAQPDGICWAPVPQA